ncbi:MAG: sulfate permease [Eubacteriales bacterium]
MKNFYPKILTTLKGYTKAQFFKDLNAGVIVAIIALPLSIALAISSGVSPEQGLHTAIIAGFLISLLGGSRVQIGGPTGAFMVVVFDVIHEFGITGLIISTIMAGIIMILFGVLKLGNMIKFIPVPITTGFTTGIALIIFSSQIKDFFGLNTPELPSEFLEKWHVYFQSINTFDITTVAIGIVSLLIIILWPRINRTIPGAFIALIVSSLAVKIFHLDVATIGSKFGELSTALPKLQIPSFSFVTIKSLINPAITIALLGSIESLLSAVVADGMIGGKHRSNTELIAQGIANIFSALFGGIPATGAIARTAANVKNGGRTPIAGIVHALTLLLIMVLFMPLASMIPLSALAAILIVVAYNMSEWRKFLSLFKSPKGDMIVLLITFSFTVLIDLVIAIEIGVILAAFIFMKRMADSTVLNKIVLDNAEEHPNEIFDFISSTEELKKIESMKGVQVYEINGPFFFGAAETFINTFQTLDPKTFAIVLRMRHVPMIDATAIHALVHFVKRCKKHRIHLLITGLKEEPRSKLKLSGTEELVGEDNFFESINEAMIFLEKLKSEKSRE